MPHLLEQAVAARMVVLLRRTKQSPRPRQQEEQIGLLVVQEQPGQAVALAGQGQMAVAVVGGTKLYQRLELVVLAVQRLFGRRPLIVLLLDLGLVAVVQETTLMVDHLPTMVRTALCMVEGEAAGLMMVEQADQVRRASSSSPTSLVVLVISTRPATLTPRALRSRALACTAGRAPELWLRKPRPFLALGCTGELPRAIWMRKARPFPGRRR